MIVYIDDDFKCHADPADDREQVETDMIADGSDMSNVRFVPPGRTWTRDDGVQFSGAMVAPWK